MRQLLPRAPMDSSWGAGWVAHVWSGLRDAVRWGAHHTGLPVMLVAAIALVVSGHIAKRTLRFGVEVALVLGLLFAATRLGWVEW